MLKVGDNLAINVEDGNTECVSLYLILCTKTFHKVRKTFTNHWGTSFDEGDDVVVGFYYHKWGNNHSSYVFLKDSHIVYVYSHLMRAVKFLMPPKNH